MAIWQVSIVLVRKENSNDFSNNIWNYMDEFEKFFPEEKSWCQSIKQYGKIDSTCMEIDTENDEILLRIDLRNISKDQLDIIIRFVESNELIIQYKNEFKEPTSYSFFEIIKESDAYNFLNDSEGYLRSISLIV